jgi:hypothetical protein
MGATHLLGPGRQRIVLRNRLLRALAHGGNLGLDLGQLLSNLRWGFRVVCGARSVQNATPSRLPTHTQPQTPPNQSHLGRRPVPLKLLERVGYHQLQVGHAHLGALEEVEEGVVRQLEG